MTSTPRTSLPDATGSNTAAGLRYGKPRARHRIDDDTLNGVIWAKADAHALCELVKQPGWQKEEVALGIGKVIIWIKAQPEPTPSLASQAKGHYEHDAACQRSVLTADQLASVITAVVDWHSQRWPVLNQQFSGTVYVLVLDFSHPLLGRWNEERREVISVPYFVTPSGDEPSGLIVIRSGLTRLSPEQEQGTLIGSLAHEVLHAVVARRLFLENLSWIVVEEMLAMDAEQVEPDSERFSQWEYVRELCRRQVQSMSGIPYGLRDGYLLFPFVAYLDALLCRRYALYAALEETLGAGKSPLKPLHRKEHFAWAMDRWLKSCGQKGLGAVYADYLAELWFVNDSASKVHSTLLATGMSHEQGPFPLRRLVAAEGSSQEVSFSLGALMGAGVRLDGLGLAASVEVLISHDHGPIDHQWDCQIWEELPDKRRGQRVHGHRTEDGGIFVQVPQGVNRLVVLLTNTSLPTDDELRRVRLEPSTFSVRLICG